MKAKIYGLINPETNLVMYVGKTTMSLKRRLCLHISKSKKDKTKKDKWILSIIPQIILLEETDICFANKKEKEWIEKFGMNNLVNGNIGGGGNNGIGIKRNESYKNNFIAYMSSSKYSKNTIKNYTSYVNNFIDYFKNEIKSPKEINSLEIEKYVKIIKNKNSRNAIIVALKLFYIVIMKQPFKLKNIKYEYLDTKM